MKEKNTYKKELAKSYALILSYCSIVMKSCIEALPNYETEVKDNPIKLLESIQNKMHDPERNCYPYESVTEALQRVINMRQNEKESLIEYAKHHKQGMDIIKSQFGTSFLDEFTEKSAEYKVELDTKLQSDMKAKAFKKWSAYLLIKNSDPEKYGKFTATLQSQYNLKKNLYSTTRTDAIEALNNHPHDNYKTKKERKEDQQLQKLLNKESTKSSFAQYGEGRCFVCGNKKHISPNCPHK